MNYETIVGLEIHAELATKTKLFCQCPNDPFHSPEPNLYICPVCVALPGTLPVMNRQAVEWAALVGLAVHGQIGWNGMTKWDRKNYFYPDLPKGYQISQYDLPLVHHGHLMVDDTQIDITRIHLEEDTGKLLHPPGTNYSLLDYNRAGVPLLELVTEPVLRSGEQAAKFAQLYQLVLRTLGVSNADMEKGEMRVEANISVRPIGSQVFGTKVEVKNLNSFKTVERAIAYETARQIELIERGGAVLQETRGWHEDRAKTFSQRIKETAADYRYFPEPDLPPVTMGDDDVRGIHLGKLREILDRIELPWQRADRYTVDFGLAGQDSARLTRDFERARYFDEVVQEFVVLAEADRQQYAQTAAKWVINDIGSERPLAAHLAELATLVGRGEITTKLAKELLGEMISTGQPASGILKDKDITVVRDTAQLETVIQQILSKNPQISSDFHAGKVQVIGFVVGQVMAATRGQADPGIVRELTQKLLEGETHGSANTN